MNGTAGDDTVIDRFSDLVGRAIAWLTLLLVLVTFAVAVLRYGFGLGWVAMQEFTVWLHGLIFMLGAGYTLRHDAHVRVDIFYNRLGKRGQAWVDLLGTLLLLLPVCGVILYSGWPYVAGAWRIGEGSREAGGLDAVYLLKSAILLLPLLLVLQGFANLGRAVAVLRGRDGPVAREAR